MPATTICQLLPIDAPDETIPHMKAHMGANHVIGCMYSRTEARSGRVSAGGV
jgi:hypothetical protein